MVDNSPQVMQMQALQRMADNRVQNSPFAPMQRKENNTGLPDNLKIGMENLSGISLDDVKVHRNSDKPAQLQAHAYAQGTDIHLGAGQEKHLPHEAWHVVQQKQGRVKPTMQLKGKVNVNDNSGLEREADVMGAKALQKKTNESGVQPINGNQKGRNSQVAQMIVILTPDQKKNLVERLKMREACKDTKEFLLKSLVERASRVAKNESNLVEIVEQEVIESNKSRTKQGTSENAGKTKKAKELEQTLDNQTWDSLLGQATEAQPKFDEIFELLKISTGAITEKYEKTKKTMVDNPANNGKTLVPRYKESEVDYSGVAPLKGEARSKQKAVEKYKGNYGRILDVVRGTLSFNTFAEMIEGMEVVSNNEAKLGYKVARCKQTYQTDEGRTGSQTLYGDIKMNIKEASTGHICELQFTLKDFIDVKQKGHHSYEEMRTYNPFGDSVVKAQEGKDNKTKGHTTRAIHGSYAAYTEARIKIEKDGDGLKKAIATANNIQKEISRYQ
jgi:hypothetical protein